MSRISLVATVPKCRVADLGATMEDGCRKGAASMENGILGKDVATKAAAEGTPSPLVNCWEIVYILLFYSAKKKGSLLYQRKKTLSFDLSHVVAYSVLLRIDPIELKGLLLEKKTPRTRILIQLSACLHHCRATSSQTNQVKFVLMLSCRHLLMPSMGMS